MAAPDITGRRETKSFRYGDNGAYYKHHQLKPKGRI